MNECNPENTFKPFLVQSEAGNLFKVVENSGWLSKTQLETLLEKLPVSFQLQKDCSITGDRFNQPLEVYVTKAAVYIYPPAGLILANTGITQISLAGQIQCCGIMDMTLPGHGQIRSCIRFNNLEIDIHVFPKKKEGGDLPGLPEEYTTKRMRILPRENADGIRAVIPHRRVTVVNQSDSGGFVVVEAKLKANENVCWQCGSIAEDPDGKLETCPICKGFFND